MSKIFDFDVNKIDYNKEKINQSFKKMKKPLSENNLKLYRSSSYLSFGKKWDTIEPPKIIKSNMSLTNANVPTKHSFLRNSNTNLCFLSNKTSRASNSSSSSLVKKFKTFDDVQIIVNDDQLKDFKQLIDYLFKKVSIFILSFNQKMI